MATLARPLQWLDGIAPFRGLRRLSLANQFLIASLLILVMTTVGIGLWVGDQIEIGVLDRTAGITAVYVESIVAPSLQSLATSDTLSRSDVSSLQSLLTGTDLGTRIVAFKVWSLAGTIRYSEDSRLLGMTFPIEGGLGYAVRGEVAAELSDLTDAENVYERGRFQRLLEVYIPVRERSTGRLLAVAEIYQRPDELDNEIMAARLRSWGVVIAASLLTYLLLAGIVRRGSDVIDRQQADLREKVDELTALLHQNGHLRERLHQAAGRATTINEQALRRISSDLHDGPGQSLALALLRLDSIREPVNGTESTTDEFSIVKHAVEDALRETRQISAGLRLPELAPLKVPEVIERVVRNQSRLTGASVSVTQHNVPDDVSLAVKIALFRTLQETLSNSARHAPGSNARVTVSAGGGYLFLEVTDQGPGFDPETVGTAGRLGLAGIREQVELLGGEFKIQTNVGHGTTVQVKWPLVAMEELWEA